MPTVKHMSDGTICRSGPTCRLHGTSVSNTNLVSDIKRQLDNAKKQVVLKDKLLPFPEGRVRMGFNKDNPDFFKPMYDLSQQIEETCEKDDDGASIGFYRMGGYIQVNAFLRGGDEELETATRKEFHGELDDATIERYKTSARKTIKNLDRWFTEKETTFEEPVILYRGVAIPDKLEDETSLAYAKRVYTPGETLEEKAYMSTSMDSDYMSFFSRTKANGSKRPPHIVYEIVAKKGLPIYEGNYGDKGHHVKEGNIQSFEREILLKRGSKFRVVAVKNVSFEHSYTPHNSWGGYINSCPKKVTYPVVQLEQLD